MKEIIEAIKGLVGNELPEYRIAQTEKLNIVLNLVLKQFILFYSKRKKGFSLSLKQASLELIGIIEHLILNHM